ncbi:glycosyltransferase [Corynebacterium glutamicum]|uniref:glycosyltransferase family protein n=1 Tax=Corynebacterium glutamicum TaxID=1718 RepID=UPI00080CBBF1|nr:glycosyltransferase [Corynebacterium glutamicum]ANU32665.1 hypothetical protein BBD29_02210 [Corynebacterium glutamicum]QWQ83329.1 hypothetical protein B5C28_02215 [Corynebacterium glutamicum]WFP71303.1 glycosyltransferase [Corynebacterium glutamicum]BCB34148.1 hypothetical protein KaCgl_21220 [Corynebacterium glutamicum]
MINNEEVFGRYLLSPRGNVRVASILDEFSYAGFAPEADFFQLSPSEWEEELESFQPQLLFVESAWRGKDNLWRNTVSKVGPEISGIIEWCKERRIPTVFWNKEDPVHFSTFLSLANLFDVVLTTDMDSVPRYKQLLGKESVFFFPFGAQTRIHNPLEIFSREDAFCFAGSYYARYPERTAALESFVKELPSVKPLVIFDRNFGEGDSTHEDYVFPVEYNDYIMGRLEPSEIDLAYKGFSAGINLNSVRTSQSMLARRVFELIASNTLIVSNFSPALETLWGKLVLFSERGEGLVRQIEALKRIPEGESRLKAQALRKVLREHTYQDRFAFICEKVGLDPEYPSPNVTVFAWVKNQEDIDRVSSAINHQTLRAEKIFFIVENEGIWKAAGRSQILTNEEADSAFVREFVGDDQNRYFTVMDPNFSYGPFYFEDLILATKYVDSPFITKGGVPRFKSDSETSSYTLAKGVDPRQAILRSSDFSDVNIADLAPSNDERLVAFSEAIGLVIDPFEFSGSESSALESTILDEGYSLSELVDAASSVETFSDVQTRKVDLPELAQMLSKRDEQFQGVLEGESISLNSSLEHGEHRYVYSGKATELANMGWEAKEKATVYLEASPGLDVMLVLLFFDENGARLSHTMAHPNKNHGFLVPENTAAVNVGFRASGPGSVDVMNIHLETFTLPSVGIKVKSPYLVLTNIYPSFENLYRNGFVHSRVKAYQDEGLDVAVVCLTESPIPRFREYDGVLVYEMDSQALVKLLQGNRAESILIHFLDPRMWSIVRDSDLDIPVHIWVHGSEVQPWWRRAYNAVTEAELEQAKEKSVKRMEFWHEVLSELPDHIDFVFVSKYFAEEVMEDVGLRIPEGKYRIIHNPIDTSVFNYVPKSVDQRLKVLSIRPYASRKYANDLSVAAVLDLRDEDYFDQLTFHFVGDGPLFEEILEPIKDLPNVQIERRFLSHREIAEYHKKYGVLLTPTRMDAQGVSRDEGMSSGLVPLTTSVAAVPEFVDEESGFLAPLDSYRELADGIRLLYKDPDLFKRMSKSATERVARQTAKVIVIEQEMSLITGARREFSNDGASL